MRGKQMNPTVEVLTRARALVARGWVQYTGHSIRGVCAAYAIMAVAQDAMLDYANPVLVFLTAMRQETKTHWPDIPGWNDMPGTTAGAHRGHLGAGVPGDRGEGTGRRLTDR